MRALADNGGFVLAEDEGRLVFLARRGLVPAWSLLVFGVVTGCLAFAAVGIAATVTIPDRWLIVGVLVGLAALAALGLRGLMRMRARRLARQLELSEAIVIVDVAGGLLLDPGGRTLAPLTGVAFTRVMQATSSARALAVRWSGGTRVVYRGDPFAGSIDEPISVMTGRGLKLT